MRHQRRIGMLGAVVALVASLSACGQGDADAPADATTPAAAATATASPPAGASPAGGSADANACAAMSAVMAKMAVAAARWDPVRDPFDAKVAAKLHALAGTMSQAQQSAGTVGTRTEIAVNAAAYEGLARAMIGGQRKGVEAAVGQTQHAYAGLKEVCGPL